MSTLPGPATLLGRARWAAIGAGLAAVAHLWAAADSGDGWMAATGLAMAAACAPCSWHLWRHPTGRACRVVLAMSLGMVGVHAALVLGAHAAAAPSSGGHLHGAVPAGQAAAEAHLAHTGTMLVVIAAELVSALLAAAAVRSARR
ncbi:hypothetical protein [Sinomonas flava]|uniref:hypothetical protein n=1 Tax=Sinomonas flava TaxID=496857 RepID=UPI0039A5F0D6